MSTVEPAADGADGGTDPSRALRLEHLDELVELLTMLGPLYVRFSAGPHVDAAGTSRDSESGLPLPGLSANPLQPEPWWTRPPRQWVARQLMQYAHLQADEERVPWVLTGTAAGRGPDGEPLLAQVHPVAVVTGPLLEEAVAVYREAFEPGRIPQGG
ncbi:DUF6098 family protein [Cellulomonas soli]